MEGHVQANHMQMKMLPVRLLLACGLRHSIAHTGIRRREIYSHID
jgi:hypothetical protein